jgi:HTH-type transcriptional regulator / antitoxin HigA
VNNQTDVRTVQDHNRATAVMHQLLDEVGEDESHPLAGVLDYLANQVEALEAEHISIPDATPHDVLRLLMEQQGLSQSDLADCAPQSRISEILNGRREISKGLAKVLAKRFGVGVGFLSADALFKREAYPFLPSISLHFSSKLQNIFSMFENSFARDKK